VLAAAVKLIEHGGYGNLTMEAIAREARVSRQTLYRWWPTKAAITLEALNEVASAVAPLPDTGSLEADLRLFLRRTVAAAHRNAPLLAGLMAEAQLDEAFADSFRAQFLANRRAVLRELLGRDASAGTADLDFLVELAFAMLWYRILAHNEPLNRKFADALADTLLALRTPPCEPPSP
jgi:AcrR family transcriptional regulator